MEKKGFNLAYLDPNYPRWTLTKPIRKLLLWCLGVSINGLFLSFSTYFYCINTGYRYGKGTRSKKKFQNIPSKLKMSTGPDLRVRLKITTINYGFFYHFTEIPYVVNDIHAEKRIQLGLFGSKLPYVDPN